MSKQTYNWKRFWCPRSVNIDLRYGGGYLPDPESEWGRACNPDLVAFEAMATQPCLILLGEAGTGKTNAMEDAYQAVCKQTNGSEDVCFPFIRLGDYNSDGDLCQAIFRNPIFQEWIQGTHKLHLFLDSLDEGLLSINTLARILKREIQNLACERLYFRITCRPAEWASSLEGELKEKWGDEKVSVYKIAPLRQIDVVEALDQHGIQSDIFLQEVLARNAISFVIKPITLKLLIQIYKQEGTLPSSQIELYEQGCSQLCEEMNPDRYEIGATGKLSVKKRMLIAGRIAAVVMFCNRTAVLDSREYGTIPCADIRLQDLCIGKEKVDGQEFDVDESSIREVFSISGLFSEQESSHRTGFAHRTYAEFLAAWYLKQHNLSLKQILNLIIDPDRRVIPQLQETTAWLASIIPEVFQEVMKTDPDLLLQSDITTIDSENKAKLVESLLKLHNEQKLEHSWFLRYNNLDHPGLAEQLESYIRDDSKNEGSRLVAIDIALHCEVKGVQDCLAAIALDSTELYRVRTLAASTICDIGDEKTKARLKPLVLGEVDNDPEDYLKGYALQAVFPKHISASELIENITQPKSQSIGGTYSNFIAKDVAEKVLIQDLPIILKWLEQFPNRYHLNYPFRQLADSIMLKAWQNLDRIGVLEAFANVAILRLKKYDGILGNRPHQESTSKSSDSTRDGDIETLLRNSNQKRRQLIETIVLLISESECDLLSIMTIIASEDVLWIIERITSAESSKVTYIWVKLLRQTLTWHNLRWRNPKYIDAILEARNISPAMESEFDIDEPGSEKAKQAEAAYLQEQAEANCLRQKCLKLSEPEPILDPPPKQTVLVALETVEANQPQLWSKIVAEMKLMPTSQANIHDDSFESDITSLPGWKEAEVNIKARIIETAKRYLNAGDLETQIWIGTNQLSDPPFTGYQALYLLVKQESEFISKLSINTWTKWIPVILKAINVPDRNVETREDNVCREIVRTAYQSAPDEFIETLTSFMVNNNYKPCTFYYVTNALSDQCLASLILARIPDENLNAGMLELLLTDLFKHDVKKAKEIAKSFLTAKAPESGEARDKAIVAAPLLANYLDNSSWSVFWSAVQQDYAFGREVLEAIASQDTHEGQIEQKIKEEYVAELYIFLTQQYPEIERPEFETQELKGVGFQTGGEFDMVRRWKNYIPQRLQARGTPEACDALRKMMFELPGQKQKLEQCLLECETQVRRSTWRPKTSEEFLQLILVQEPSSSDLLERIQQMADQPKTDNSINIGPGSNINGVVNTGDGKIKNNPGKPDEKRINWGNWLALISAVAAIVAIPVGIFNPEIKQQIKQLFNHNPPIKIEQQSQPTGK